MSFAFLIAIVFMASGSAYITQDRGTYDETMDLLSQLEKYEARAEGIRERIALGTDKTSAEKELKDVIDDARTTVSMFLSRYQLRQKSGLVAGYVSGWYRSKINRALQKVCKDSINVEEVADDNPRSITSSPRGLKIDDLKKSDEISKYEDIYDSDYENRINTNGVTDVADEDKSIASYEKSDISPRKVDELVQIIKNGSKEIPDDSYSKPMTVVLENAYDRYPQTGLSKSNLVVEYCDNEKSVLVASFSSDAVCAGPVASLDEKTKSIADWMGGNLIHTNAETDFVLSEQSAERKLLYTKPKSLKDNHKSKELNSVFNNTGEKPVGTTQAGSINIQYEGGLKISYNLDGERYIRSVNDRPHVDALTKSTITFDNVVLLQLKGEDKEQFLNGFGTALIFNKGKLTNGVWLRDSENGPASLYDRMGVPISIDSKSTMITLVHTDDKVIYSNGHEMASM